MEMVSVGCCWNILTELSVATAAVLVAENRCDEEA